MNDSRKTQSDLQFNQAINDLDWDIQPQRDLWPDISSRIRFASQSASRSDQRDTPSVTALDTTASTKTTTWAPFAVAASTVVAVVSMVFSYMSYQMVQETNLKQEAMALYQQAQLNLIEEQHQLVRVQFIQLLQNDHGQLNSEFASEARKLMANIDQASAEIKRAIELQPNNPDYTSMLANTYQQELFLLNKVRRQTQSAI